MNATELYALIGILVAAVLALSGLWVRAQDAHRLWATTKIVEHERVIGILDVGFKRVGEDVAEIKRMIEDHTRQDRKFQAAMAQKFSIKVED